MLRELCHEALAETHNFTVGLALRVEVGTTLTTADWKACQGVLEALLETEELQDRKVNGRMQTETALIRSDGGVELYTETTVYLYLALIVQPRNAECNDTLRLNHSLQKGLCLILRVTVDNRLERLEDFENCLMEFFLIRILLQDVLIDTLYILILKCHSFIPP